MIRAALLAAVLLAGPAAATAARAQQAPVATGESSEPYALVRSLQALQERIAQGDSRAHGAQRDLINQIGQRMAEADAATWQSERNARAAVIFVLSGGPPSLLRRLVALDPKPRIDERILRGALAYVEGNEAGARAQLDTIDPRTLPPSLGAQLALIQAAIVVRDQPARAVALLGLARLLAPGSLVEEGALRREIGLEGQRGNFDRFEALTAIYLRRYRGSVYAGNFRQRLGVIIMGLDLDRDPDRLARVEALLARFEPEGRRDLLLSIARHAMIHGRTNVARRTAARAADLSAGGSPEAERAAFYAAAALVTTPDADEGARGLLAIDSSRLTAADLRLYEAITQIAVQVVEPLPLPAGPTTRVALGAPGPGEAPVPDLPGSETLRRAERLLGDTDILLERSRQ